MVPYRFNFVAGKERRHRFRTVIENQICREIVREWFSNMNMNMDQELKSKNRV